MGEFAAGGLGEEKTTGAAEVVDGLETTTGAAEVVATDSALATEATI